MLRLISSPLRAIVHIALYFFFFLFLSVSLVPSFFPRAEVYRMKIITDSHEEFWNARVEVFSSRANQSRCVLLISFHLKPIENYRPTRTNLSSHLFTLIDIPIRPFVETRGKFNNNIINILHTRGSCNFPSLFADEEHVCARARALSGKFCEKNREIRSEKMLARKTRFRLKFPHSYSIWNFKGVIPWFISPYHLWLNGKKKRGGTCSSDQASVIFLTYAARSRWRMRLVPVWSFRPRNQIGTW